MATIKAIEGASVHQIQSGQVIVDLCSVVKELVENSLDAGATSIDIRFKNNGLDSIEVQDNGDGISPADHETIALKHYTSKLSSYTDLSSLTTFGFRGEALSSLCALSSFHIVTAKAEDGAKGTRLEFETSGKLKGKSVVAAQKGTTVIVEEIFKNLPVRRRELVKNVKREYGKVLGVLNAYACISTGVRFSVSNQPAKGKKMVVFSTKANPTTRENIANVYGAKTLLAILPLDLTLQMTPQPISNHSARNRFIQADTSVQPIHLQGHISRPVVGEGRQTPDRQMFFVNSRPCGLPQVAKAINEVYKSYNVTQSPFIFANLKMDTAAYDVNVSPDKRTILLHDQTALLETLKTSLLELFGQHDQSVPQVTPLGNRKLPIYKSHTLVREVSGGSDNIQALPKATAQVVLEADEESYDKREEDEEDAPQPTVAAGNPVAAKKRQEKANAELRSRSSKITETSQEDVTPAPVDPNLRKPVQDFNTRMGVRQTEARRVSSTPVGGRDGDSNTQETLPGQASELPLFTTGMALLGVNPDTPGKKTLYAVPVSEDDESDEESEDESDAESEEERIPSVTTAPRKSASGVVQNAFDRMRPKRASPDTATITIGDQTTVTIIGTTLDRSVKRRRIMTPKLDYTNGKKLAQSSAPFARGLRGFAAPGTQMAEEIEEDEGNDPAPVLAAFRRGTERKSSVRASSNHTDADILDLDDPSSEAIVRPATSHTSEDMSDDDYEEPAEKKAREEARVEELIKEAEEAAARPTSENVKRAATALRGKIRKDSTLQLVQHLDTNIERIEKQLALLTSSLQAAVDETISVAPLEETLDVEEAAPEESTAEARLSLTVSKADFAQMRIIGQFNLGFILALRPSTSGTTQDELFIIDQHASDEKYNFERLQAETVVQNQRLVRPLTLDLTAVEEEIVLEHRTALEKNGFILQVDTSGDLPVGQRCRLVSLPMSKETTFSSKDLEELISLLAESGSTASSSTNMAHVPRPSKVRSMFAMRACRSSIMVGKPLSKVQMARVVTHMGEIERPWNCPHGRPTMRHLFGVGNWEGWKEGDGLGLDGTEKLERRTDWAAYLKREVSEDSEEDSEEDNDEEEEEESGIAVNTRKYLFTQE